MRARPNERNGVVIGISVDEQPIVAGMTFTTVSFAVLCPGILSLQSVVEKRGSERSSCCKIVHCFDESVPVALSMQLGRLEVSLELRGPVNLAILASSHSQ